MSGIVDHGAMAGGEFVCGQLGCEVICDPCAPCGPVYGDMWWAELDFLLWWRSGRYFPALATTGDPGVIGEPGVRVLFGDGELTEQARPGGRLNFGMWLEPCQTIGIGGSFLTLGNARARFSADENQYPFLAVPYWDAKEVRPHAYPVVNPNSVPARNIGSIEIESNSDFLAADAFLRTLWLQGPVTRVDFIFGYQLARIDEDLLLNTNTQEPLAPIITTHDAFRVQNEFHGGHFGLKGQYRWGALSLDLSAKVGFGNMAQRAQLENLGTHDLLIHPSNEGTHRRDEFSYMHDVGISLAYYPVERLKLSVGYSMIFFSDVVRPGEVMDTQGGQPVVDSDWFGAPQAPLPTRPAFDFNSTHYYVHGLNAGLEFRF